MLKQEVNPELVQAAWSDFMSDFVYVFQRLLCYVLLVGLYYFYTKQHNRNKRGLLDAIAALDIKGVLPTKVTGTR